MIPPFSALPKVIIYFLVGAGCAGLANLVIIVGDQLGVHYVFGSLLSLFGVGAIGYVSHSLWTFRAPLSWGGYYRFVLGLFIGSLAATGALFVGVTILGHPVALVSPVVTVLITGWNYLSARWAIGIKGRSISSYQAPFLRKKSSEVLKPRA